MLCSSYAHLCSEHFAECNFVNFKWWNTKWGLLQNGICRAIHRVTDLQKKSSSNLQGWSWQAASAQHDTKNWEIHWYSETSANKAKTKSLTRMPTAKKDHKRKRPYTNACGKERKNRPQMPVAKKERANHKCWWQTKNGLPNSQANSWHQMKENSWNHLKTPNGCLPASIRWKKHQKMNKQTKTTKSQQSNRLLSATKECTTTVRRAQSKNNCANDKQMESQTFHN